MSLTVTAIVKKAALTVNVGGKASVLDVSMPRPAVLISAGVRSGPPGPAAAKNVFVQNDAPDFGGEPGLWVQTGMPGGAMTMWIEDGL